MSSHSPVVELSTCRREERHTANSAPTVKDRHTSPVTKRLCDLSCTCLCMTPRNQQEKNNCSCAVVVALAPRDPLHQGVQRRVRRRSDSFPGRPWPLLHHLRSQARAASGLRRGFRRPQRSSPLLPGHSGRQGQRQSSGRLLLRRLLRLRRRPSPRAAAPPTPPRPCTLPRGAGAPRQRPR